MHLTKSDRIKPVKVFKKLVDDMIEGNVEAHITSISASADAPETIEMMSGHRIVTGPTRFTYVLEIVSNKPLTIDID